MAEETNNPLAEENAALKKQVAELEAAKKQTEADEVVIREKMAKGLRREQAIAVIERQREYDKNKSKTKNQEL